MDHQTGTCVARDMDVTMTQDTPKAITLNGETGGNIHFEISFQPAHGTVTEPEINTGKVTYTPASGYMGSDSFTFTVDDESNPSSPPATVSITIEAAAPAPPVPAPTPAPAAATAATTPPAGGTPTIVTAPTASVATTSTPGPVATGTRSGSRPASSAAHPAPAGPTTAPPTAPIVTVLPAMAAPVAGGSPAGAPSVVAPPNPLARTVAPMVATPPAGPATPPATPAPPASPVPPPAPSVPPPAPPTPPAIPIWRRPNFKQRAIQAALLGMSLAAVVIAIYFMMFGPPGGGDGKKGGSGGGAPGASSGALLPPPPPVADAGTTNAPPAPTRTGTDSPTSCPGGYKPMKANEDNLCNLLGYAPGSLVPYEIKSVPRDGQLLVSTEDIPVRSGKTNLAGHHVWICWPNDIQLDKTVPMVQVSQKLLGSPASRIPSDREADPDCGPQLTGCVPIPNSDGTKNASHPDCRIRIPAADPTPP